MSARLKALFYVPSSAARSGVASLISLILLTACSSLGLNEAPEDAISDPYIGFTEAIAAVEPLLDPTLDAISPPNPDSAAIKRQVDSLPAVTPLTVTDNLALLTSPDLLPLNETLYQRFIQEGYGGVMDINSMNASTAIQQFCQQPLVTLLTVSREMTPEEAADCRAKGRNLVQFAIGKDALVLVVNPQTKFVRGVTTDRLKTILTANTWSAVVSSWPAEPIDRAIIGPDSAAVTLLAKTLFDNNSETLLNAPNATAYSYPEPLIQALSLTPYGLGIINYSTYQQLPGGLRAVPINGISASPKTIEQGAYLLGQTAYLYGDQQQIGSATAAGAAINFYLTRVNDVMPEVSLLPLSASQLNQSKATLSKILLE
ncbi:MAG: substrate-binding domain-containing protein [Cyanobacteria bacterium P01_D01_bin.105]